MSCSTTSHPAYPISPRASIAFVASKVAGPQGAEDPPSPQLVRRGALVQQGADRARVAVLDVHVVDPFSPAADCRHRIATHHIQMAGVQAEADIAAFQQTVDLLRRFDVGADVVMKRRLVASFTAHCRRRSTRPSRTRPIHVRSTRYRCRPLRCAARAGVAGHLLGGERGHRGRRSRAGDVEGVKQRVQLRELRREGVRLAKR